MKLIEKNEVSVFEGNNNNNNNNNINEIKDLNNQDLKNKRESSIISRNKRGSINKGGSMRQKKADINFTHK